MSEQGGGGRSGAESGAPGGAQVAPGAAALGALAGEVFDTMPIGVAVLGADGMVRHVNPVLADLLGVSRAELLGRSLLELVEPEEREAAEQRLEQLVEGQRNSFECLLPASPPALSGLSWSLRAYVAPAFGVEGRVEEVVIQVFDFGPAGSPPPLPAGLAAVLEEGSDFLLTIGPDRELVYGNRAARETLAAGVPGGATELAQVLDAASLGLYLDTVEPALLTDGSWQGELALRTREGRSLTVSARIVTHRPVVSTDTDDVGPRTVSIFARDITELKTAERKLRQLATHDYLTGLPNRLLLQDRLELALNRYARYGTPVSLMFCDLDGFKPVNDAFGHQVGDAVLTEVADRIHSVIRDTDTAARLGGDEFAVLVEGTDDLDLLTTIANRLISAIAEPIPIGGSTARVGISIGVVLASDQCDEPDAMVAAADSAMYRAKSDGRGRYHVWASEAR